MQSPPLIRALLKKKPYLLWWVKEPQNVSLELATQAILGHGDFDDAKKLFRIAGIKRIKRVFEKQIHQHNSYHPRTIHFFKCYFKRHA